MIGEIFGRLTVASSAPRKNGRDMWLCKCTCGGMPVVVGKNLRLGISRSCGCARIETLRVHGMSSMPEYSVWKSMKYRCGNPKSKLYKNYGGRGIQVDPRWSNSFEAFIADMGERPSPLHSIDRLDNDGPYGPGNCRWATRTEQQRNRRACRRVVRSDGMTFPTIVDAAEASGVSPSTILGACKGRNRSAAGYAWGYADAAA